MMDSKKRGQQLADVFYGPKVPWDHVDGPAQENWVRLGDWVNGEFQRVYNEGFAIGAEGVKAKGGSDNV